MVGVHGTVGLYTIGQTPRPDLIDELRAGIGPVEIQVHGLLDGIEAGQIPPLRQPGHPEAYPLETRLRDGTRVEVDAAFLKPRLQEAVSRWDSLVMAHLVLCAGPFPGLSSDAPLIVPFEAGVSDLAEHGIGTLDIAVPFGAQAGPALRKWEAAGFRGQVHDLGAKSEEIALGDWVREVRADSDADAWVFDYVGLPSEVFEAAVEVLDIPVFDLGRLALDALGELVERKERL